MTQLISLYDIAPLAADLASGELLLTPNQRLASRMSNAYAIFCRDNHHPVVAAPNIQSINQWLAASWQQLLLAAYPPAIERQLLSSAEQLIIVERIISESEQGQQLLRPRATAQHVVNAYDSFQHWLLDKQSSEIQQYFSGDDAQILLQWFQQFDDYCQQKAYLAPIQQHHIVIAAFEAGVLKKQQTIASVALDKPTPLQKKLINSACEHWRVIDNNRPAAAQQVAVACENSEQEIVVAALWAKQQLKNAINPNQLPTIAIVIPSLGQQRDKVVRIFQEVFCPEFQNPNYQRNNLPFNISAGSPLGDEPIIAASFLALAMNAAQLDCDQIINCLLSPFFLLSEQDENALARLISLLREEQRATISSARVRQLVEKVSAEFFAEDSPWPLLSALIEQANLARAMGLSKKQPLSEWAVFFKQSLFALAWPGRRKIDSIEYQALKQWQQALQLFVSQSGVLGNVDFNDALNLFKQQLAGTVFQAQTVDSPIQILGALEAAGLHFDYLWLSGMSSKEWPAAPAPNPLLPISLQRAYAMPNATAEGELEYARLLSQGFIHSTDNLCVSYAKVIDDNPASVSGLFAEFEQCSPEQLLKKSIDVLLPHSELRRRYFSQKKLQPYEAYKTRPLSAEELVKGGSSLFANQAACPFKAFATHRLALVALAEPVLGLDHASRGNLLHRALELIWKQLEHSQALIDLTQDEQSKLCQDYAEYALNEMNHRQGNSIGPRQLRIERDRLSALLSAWLAVERERAAFTVVSREERKVFRFSQLELVARVDRVDQLSDGSQLVIDYKTGKSSINSWWGDRPEQPQLPLYSSLLEQEGREVSAVCFAQVHIDGCELKGVGGQECPQPTLQWNSKIQSSSGAIDWPQLKQHWQQTLTALAQDFIAGKSLVDPKDKVKSCQYCDLASVCRINHQGSNAMELSE
ncbi:PD-(D/E)XK nuclease family protein [Dasania sp. GY-MA-18]|uniref:PD-(D/E)XK nuclease family protein n=1 Tax=Dasania phycosphaerae TaxID=2950436 RepID=A0A9J6RJP1_9GAMM|nr:MULTISPECIES: PD-(D/E)XK nuclease family protein [Dasania]MCR8921769.1 PD-(D/E)XK nuclease family protein [Dasania sp. GY-MA-18]MCZ0864197.1 PD-(D/E)XK nuclease family protein [Dasania phycosphaerae]MCZ0867925.1 PD-(D/E)XK nuclease family protein [Dasania phycosphaerae]